MFSINREIIDLDATASRCVEVVRKPAETLASRFCVELIDAVASRCVEVVRKPAEILDKSLCVEVRRGDASRWPLLRKGAAPGARAPLAPFQVRA